MKKEKDAGYSYCMLDKTYVEYFLKRHGVP